MKTSLEHGGVRPLAAAALAVAAALAGPLAAGTETADVARQVREILSGDRGRDDAVVGRLVALGPGAIPELFRVQLGTAEDGPGADSLEAALSGGDRGARLSLEALVRMPAARVVEHLDALLVSEPTPEVGLAALRVAGHLGDGEAAPFVVRCLCAFEGPSTAAGPLHRAGVDALVRLFDEAPRSLLGIDGEALATAPDDVLGIVLSAVDRAAPPEAVAFLAGILGKGRPREIEVLELIGRTAVRFPWRSNIDVPVLVRPYLLRPDARSRQVAATLLGELHDLEAVELLIQLLGDKDERVSQAAHEALVTMAGADRGTVPAAWRAFVKEEGERWAAAAQALETVRSGEGPRLSAARTIAAFGLHRPDVAHVLVESLDGEPAYVAGALELLGSLGQRSVVPEVIPLLDHPDRQVRAAATACLRTLTGERLASAEAWRAWARG